MFKVGITGHRPERIKNKRKEVENWLDSQIKNLKSCYGNIVLLDGMAEGVDQLAAVIGLKNGAEVNCYFPYKRKLSDVDEYIVENAAGVSYECEKFQKDCYFRRDRRIVDDCDLLLVVWDGKENGGTYYTYSYAKKNNKNILIFPWKEV